MSDTTTVHRPALYSILWACAASWCYGYHLSELNFPAVSITCLPQGIPPPSRLPLCLGINQHRYGLITAIYTVGGLVGSLASSKVVEKQGIKGGLLLSSYINLLGVIIMTTATHWNRVAAGRLIAGASTGIAICLVPPFLSQIAKASPQLSGRAGQVGTLHQMAIVIGLFTAQAAGMIFTGSGGDIPGNWRYVTGLSGVVAIIHILTATQVYSPEDDSKTPVVKARRNPEDGLSPVPELDEAASPLLESSDPLENSSSQTAEAQMTLRELLSNSALRGPTLLCAAILALQQLCGVNAVMFYSTPVLKPLMPSLAGAIGIGITFINALMTVVTIFLVDRLERRQLLLGSILGMALMSFGLAFGLDNGYSSLSAAAIILFIVAYSVGLGPIPFLLVSETVPSPGIPALSSLALSLSWISAFFIAIGFLPLRDALSEPVDPRDPLSDRKGEGRVFFVFTGVCLFTALLVWRGLGKKT